MSEHLTAEFGPDPTTGWFSAICICGWRQGPLPDAETTVDALMEHASAEAASRAFDAGAHGQHDAEAALAAHRAASPDTGLDAAGGVIYQLARESLATRDRLIANGWIVDEMPEDAEVRSRLAQPTGEPEP